MKPKAIGGWLILPMLSLFAHPLRWLTDLIRLTVAIRKIGGLARSLELDQHWVVLSFIDTALSMSLAAWAFFVMPGFFQKRRATIWRMQLLFGAAAVANAYSLVATGAQVQPTSPTYGASWSVGLPILWIWYFRASKRVQETFIR